MDKGSVVMGDKMLIDATCDKLTYVTMVPVKDTGKTMVWHVLDRGGAKIGEVKWFGRWRKYAFFPIDAIFEEVCLREIAGFIQGRTALHRKGIKQNPLQQTSS